MKVLEININCGRGSTGRIATDIADKYKAEGHECRIAFGRGAVPEKYRNIAVRIGNDFDVKFHGAITRIFDRHGFASKNATKKFLKWAEDYNPDLIWLHNIHGYYINIEMLFDWIKSRPNMEVKWTLHDCWAFTGHCAYFTMVRCEKWKTHCYNCPAKETYPSSILFDNCKQNYDRKKASFTGVKNMMLITPSQWLADLTGESFLKGYPLEVHYNTIDTNVFKPTNSNFREKYGLKNKIIVLGVASKWDKRKGLDDFVRLSKLLDDRFAIVLVGVTKKQIGKLGKNIVGIMKTENVNELVKIYSSADVFVNPSKEESFGMTTIEAQSCGTTTIVYKDTACEEIVNKESGKAVCQTPEAIAKELAHMFEGRLIVPFERNIDKQDKQI